MKLKAMRTLFGAALVACTALTMQPHPASAQGSYHRDERRHEDRRYLGSYFRTLPDRRGTEMLAISPGGTATMTRADRRGRTETFNGTWYVRRGNLHLDIAGPRGNRMSNYNLSGSNLNLVGNSHIFYKKQ